MGFAYALIVAVECWWLWQNWKMIDNDGDGDGDGDADAERAGVGGL